MNKTLQFTFVFIISLWIAPLGAQTYLISEGGTVNTCSGTIYDSGGAAGNYQNNEHYEMTFCSDDPDGCFQLNFLSFNVENFFDSLYIYAGPTATGTPYATLTGNITPGVISTGSNCVTLVFDTDVSVTPAGFAIEITCVCPTCDDGIWNGQEIATDCGGPECPECDFYVISEGGTITGCDATLMDSGINGPYAINEDYTMTFCGDGSGDCLLLDFLVLNISAGDHLYIYDGSDTNGFLIADLTNTTSPAAIVAPGTCVTFNFTSNGFTNAPGFEVDITCDGVCPTCDDGVSNGYEIGVDCGGPECEECDFIIISQGGTATTCSSTLYDSGLFGDYSNSEFHVVTICADDTASCLGFDFLSFNVENFYDSLIVYDGLDINSPIIGAYSGILDPFVLSAPGTCATFKFISDASVIRPGFEIAVSCVCPTCDDGIWNGEEVDTDCGGPDCPECLFNVISEEGLVTGCDEVLFDSGINGQYAANENYSMTFCGDGTDECLLIDFTSLNIAFGDHLYIYDGQNTDGFLIADITNSTAQLPITAPSGCVTFNFVSDGFTNAAGFEIHITCDGVCPTCDDGILNGYEIGVDCGGPDCEECEFIVMNGNQTESSCSTTIYDNGLFGNYANGSDDVLTICSDEPGGCMQLEFISFEIESGWDFLSIYDGEDMSAPLIGTYTGTVIPQFISTTGGCLTIHFTSDGIIDDPGYEIAVSCVCPTCDDGVLNGAEIGIDCGGPDCEECDFILISSEETITTCSGTVFDSGINQDYQVNEDYTMTICAADSGSCIQLDFASFELESGFDFLTIHAGEDVGGEVLQSFTGNLGAFTFTTAQSCITLNFFSDFIIADAGFQFDISCVECAQPSEQDCLGANEVCGEIYIQESYPPAPGNFPVQLPPEACLDNAVNVIWYVLSVEEAGNLSFVLTPEQATDDYDWALFNMTDMTCEDISTNPDMIVSCNSYGILGPSGPTGISTANGGVGNVNGPGDLNGPPFNADYPVQAGETYALLVQNWTGSFDGYTLDFSETTAGLYTGGDEGLNLQTAFPLGLVEISSTCDTALARVSRGCSVDSVYYAFDYLVNDSTATYGVDYEPLPTLIALAPGQSDSTFVVQTILDGIDEGVEYICVEVSTSDTEFGEYLVLDTVCVAIVDNYTFPVTADLEYIYCPRDSTELYAFPQFPSTGPYSYTWFLNGEEVYDDIPFDVPIPQTYLDSTVYEVMVMDYCGAMSDPAQSVVANYIPAYPSVEILGLTDYCPGVPLTLNAAINGGTQPFTYTWLDEYLVTYNDSANVNVDPQLNYPGDSDGQVTYYLTIADVCSPARTDSASLTIQFPEPMAVSVTMNSFICTDQVLELSSQVFGGYPPYTYDWRVEDLNGTTQDVLITPFPFTGEGFAAGFIEDAMLNEDAMYVLELEVNDWCTATVGSLLDPVFDADTVEARNCFVPNIVSANGDGVNDSFTVYRLINTPGTLSIFNRWGNLLKQTSLPTWTPEDEPAGTYFYTVSYRNGESEKGSFTIVR